MFRIILLSLLLSTFCYSQIPVESYRNDILNLSSIEAVSRYWDQLSDIDQKVLLDEKDLIQQDSISTSLMIRTVLLFEYQKENTFKLYKITPVINMAHCMNSLSTKLFWTIIEQYKVVINKIMNNYPAYSLESISLNYYGYSLFKQDLIYDKLISKLQRDISNEKVIEELLASHEKFKKTHSLKEIKELFKWQFQPFKDLKEEGFFEFVTMSDGGLYRKTNYGYLQKLNLVKKKGKYKYYQIEGEPFDWIYKLGKDGSLFLIDNENVLIEYTKLN